MITIEYSTPVQTHYPFSFKLSTCVANLDLLKVKCGQARWLVVVVHLGSIIVKVNRIDFAANAFP